MIGFSWLFLVLPLAGLILNLALGRMLGRRATGVVASAAIGLTFLLAVAVAPEAYRSEHGATVHLWSWIALGDFQVPMALLVDPLSITMVLVVTGVGCLIHIYAIGYMEDDPRFTRFFLYLNFFILAMLLLVLGDGFLTLFIGWEGVGLASFLLIGFWFDRRDELYGSYADCGKKAFIVNRIGDVGLILAMCLIWTSVGTLAYADVFAHLETGSALPLTAICLLLLLAVAGKSAQFPLYVWLPDAMAGPTPVSALIHAATMVTAGIYLMARTHVMWDMPGNAAGEIAAWIGVGTAFIAGFMAVVQHDLKKVLAYSTISQLGYMVLGAGVGAYAMAIFHLVTHAFFKALLFLSAGSVQHATHELDMRRLGGLREKMPRTARLFLIGAMALAGIPLLSGFFSKDGILLYTYLHSLPLYVVGLLTALLTAVYAFRAYFMTFRGTPRDEALFSHAHESGPLMLLPMGILALLTLFGGALNLPFVLTLEHALEAAVGHLKPPDASLEVTLLLVSGGVALLGFWLAWSAYRRRYPWADSMRATMKPLARIARHQWYLDALYDDLLLPYAHRLSQFLTHTVDQSGVDRLVNQIASVTFGLSRKARQWHNGLVPTYAFSLFVGATVLVAYFWLLA